MKKNKSYICHSKLQPILNNTVVIENMTNIREKESCYNRDTIVECGNIVGNLQTKLRIVTNTTIKDKKNKIFKNI